MKDTQEINLPAEEERKLEEVTTPVEASDSSAEPVASVDAAEEIVAPEEEAEVEVTNADTDSEETPVSTALLEENYARKLQLIDQLKVIVESQEDFSKRYSTFKEIQQKWKEIKEIPQEHVAELNKNYQTQSEAFYKLVKLNNEFRDLDFKKNLGLKTALCETVEKLVDENDVVSAFHQLQKLHQQWREIGPVAKDLRESLWARFKEASRVINKRHMQYHETMRKKEEENLAAKISICEKIESIDLESLKTFKHWDDKSKEIIALQAEWKSYGFAPKKVNTKLYERYRAACDLFFTRKNEAMKSIKATFDKNMELKRALCQKAEALKDSTDWKSTTDQLIALQKEWKTIGPVLHRQSNTIWKRFQSACDYFFEQKEKNTSSKKSEEQNNLAAKKAIIAKIKDLSETDPEEAIDTLKEYMAEWNGVGHVPFKEKDKIYNAYREAIDEQYDRLKIDQNDRRMRNFRNNLNDMGAGEQGKGKLYGERDKLMRSYERMKSELQTYENNIGFLSVSSKGGGGLLKEMERKIEKLKDEMNLIVQKIAAIDENLE